MASRDEFCFRSSFPRSLRRKAMGFTFSLSRTTTSSSSFVWSVAGGVGADATLGRRETQADVGAPAIAEGVGVDKNAKGVLGSVFPTDDGTTGNGEQAAVEVVVEAAEAADVIIMPSI